MKNLSILSNKDLLEKAVEESLNYIDVLRKMGFKTKSGNYKTLQKYIKIFNIDITHFETPKERLKRIGVTNKKYELEDILIENFQGGVNNVKIKNWLYKEGLKQPICELCGQDNNWVTGKIPLILDHINGTHKDNRLENLRILCHNCDATLSTYMGRNKKSKEIKILAKNRENIVKENNKQKLIERIINSNVDFSKRGWRLEIAKILNKTPQYTGNIIKEYIPEIWDNCFRHKDRN